MNLYQFQQWLESAIEDYRKETMDDGADLDELSKREWIDDFIGWLDTQGND